MMRTDPVLCEITGSKSNLKCNQLVLVCSNNLTSDLPVGLKINQSSWSTSIYLFRLKEEMRSWFRPSLLSFQVSGVFFCFTALDPLAAQHWIWSQDLSAVGFYHFWHSCCDQEQTSPAKVTSLLQVTDTHSDVSVRIFLWFPCVPEWHREIKGAVQLHLHFVLTGRTSAYVRIKQLTWALIVS